MKIPSKSIIRSLFGLCQYGYEFIQKNCQRYQSDIFKIRLGGFKVICFTGEEAAAVFYDNDKMMRKGAVPPPVQHTLTGKNAIHTTDGTAHRQRKQMFLSLMTHGNIAALNNLFRNEFYKTFQRAGNKPFIVLFTEAHQALCKTVCTWAGVPLEFKDVPGKSADFVAMVDAFGSVGLRNWRGRLARKRIERWIKKLVKDVRENRLITGPGTALQLAAGYTDENGKILNERLAAIELINILRPTIAIAWYIVFAAKALEEYPACRQEFLENNNDYRLNFVNEIRRFYPFAPFMGAKVRHTFSWNGFEFPKGALVLLDMYGTNHDTRLWDEPSVFNPDRFKDRNIKPFDFLAQGGGYAETGHRCPGELVTVTLLKTAVEFLTRDIKYKVPGQDLSVDLSRMPTLPKSGMIMTDISKA